MCKVKFSACGAHGLHLPWSGFLLFLGHQPVKFQKPNFSFVKRGCTPVASAGQDIRHKISHKHKRYVLRENSRACTRLQGLKKLDPSRRAGGGTCQQTAATSLRCASYWCWLRADHMLTVAASPLLSLSLSLSTSRTSIP